MDEKMRLDKYTRGMSELRSFTHGSLVIAIYHPKSPGESFERNTRLMTLLCQAFTIKLVPFRHIKEVSTIG